LLIGQLVEHSSSNQTFANQHFAKRRYKKDFTVSGLSTAGASLDPTADAEGC